MTVKNDHTCAVVFDITTGQGILKLSVLSSAVYVRHTGKVPKVHLVHCCCTIAQ